MKTQKSFFLKGTFSTLKIEQQLTAESLGQRLSSLLTLDVVSSLFQPDNVSIERR